MRRLKHTAAALVAVLTVAGLCAAGLLTFGGASAGASAPELAAHTDARSRASSVPAIRYLSQHPESIDAAVQARVKADNDRDAFFKALEQQQQARFFQALADQQAAQQQAAQQQAQQATANAASRASSAGQSGTGTGGTQVSSGRCGGSLPSCCIMNRESHGSLTAVNGSSGAAGKWQFMPSTWNHFGGYASAAQAPEAVQDARAQQLWAGGAGASHWAGNGC